MHIEDGPGMVMSLARLLCQEASRVRKQAIFGTQPQCSTLEEAAPAGHASGIAPEQ